MIFCLLLIYTNEGQQTKYVLTMNEFNKDKRYKKDPLNKTFACRCKKIMTNATTSSCRLEMVITLNEKCLLLKKNPVNSNHHTSSNDVIL